MKLVPLLGAFALGVMVAAPAVASEEIIKKAREHGVYVHESPELVALLTQVDIDQHIPPQLYLAVAELLAWLYRLENGESLPAPTQIGRAHV